MLSCNISRWELLMLPRSVHPIYMLHWTGLNEKTQGVSKERGRQLRNSVL